VNLNGKHPTMKKSGSPLTVVSPSIAHESERSFDWQKGPKKKLPKTPLAKVRLNWPQQYKDRNDLLKEWHTVAMQVAAGRFRVLAVLWRFINYESGTFYPSDKTLSQCAGGCSTKTISREIAFLRDAGILDVETTRTKEKDGTFKTRRVLYPTFPRDLPPDILMSEDAEGMDT
jgi:hypothetical protein